MEPTLGNPEAHETTDLSVLKKRFTNQIVIPPREREPEKQI
jgi:hypothetical protein